jgi:hypothetical protein
MVDVLDREMQLILVAVMSAAYSVPRSVRILSTRRSCSSKNGITRSLRMSAAVSGVLRV